MLIVLIGPSGSGKTTLADRLGYPRVLTTTTRKPREGEFHGKDYYFTSKEQFEVGIENGDFLEYAEVHGNYYGSSKVSIYKALESSESGKATIILDVNGARSLKIRSDLQSITFFLMPPSPWRLHLTRRLMIRGDSNQVIDRRMETAEEEIKCAGEFDHLIVTENLDQAVSEIEGILSGPL